MNDREEPVCALCGSNQAHRLFTGRDRLLGLPGSFPVVECSQCSLVYTSPRPSAIDLATYYPERYGVYAPGGGQARRMSLYHGRIARMLDQMITGPARSVLDAGCGEGAFLSEMVELGWTATGLEMNAGAAERARRDRSLEVVTGTLETTVFPDAKFDLVTMSHLLEHLPQPREAIRTVHRWIRPEGALFITLPNVASWERRCFGSDWYPWDLPRHLYHFSPATLTRLLDEEGFEVKELRFLNAFYIPQSLRYRFQTLQQEPGEPTVAGKPQEESMECTSPDLAKPPAESAGFGLLKETVKTVLFQAVLSFAFISGRYFQGEVQEVIAVRR